MLSLLSLFILSQLVIVSHQQCLGTSKLIGSSFTFALAQVNGNINRNLLAAQEACYFGCGAQIVTQSANQGDMFQLTLMDNAVFALRDAGFLNSGQTYILNHLGMQTEQGGNGIGCIQLLKNKFNHYPKEHPLCAQAKVAICGFWGRQSIPNKPNPNPILTATFTSSRQSSIANPSTSLNNPASSSTVQAVQSGSSSTISSVPSTPTSNPVTPPLENGIVNQFDVNGIKYHVLKKQSSSLAQAQSVCGQIPGSTIGGITSDVYQAVTSQLQRLSFANSKVIIGSWNGDSYSMIGGDCMILQLNNGIYPGQCSEASAILCQSW